MVVLLNGLLFSTFGKTQFRLPTRGFLIDAEVVPTFEFDVCVTVHLWYNNINSKLDATITNFVDNCNRLNMAVATRQHHRCIVPQAVNTV